jgi:hypothetical protein
MRTNEVVPRSAGIDTEMQCGDLVIQRDGWIFGYKLHLI